MRRRKHAATPGLPDARIHPFDFITWWDMTDQHRDDSDRFTPPFSPASVAGLMGRFFDMVTRMVTGQEVAPPGQTATPTQEEPPRREQRGIAMEAITPGRPMIGYINTGIHKMEQMRRQTRMMKQYRDALKTISLTKRAIRRTPRASRYLFKGYYGLLKDARRRIQELYAQIGHTQSHLRAYDPFALADEIKVLERTARTSSSPAARAEAELRLETRRGLLDSVGRLDDQLGDLAGQLGAIASALEINHLRVVQIASQTSYRSGADMLDNRMREVTEQLSLLEESLRELGNG